MPRTQENESPATCRLVDETFPMEFRCSALGQPLRIPDSYQAAKMDVVGAHTMLRSLALTLSEDGTRRKRGGP